MRSIINKDFPTLKEKKQAFFPVKSPKKKPRDRWFNYLVLIHEGDLLVKQRLQKDIWEKLYEFVLKEETGAVLDKSIMDPSYWGLKKSLFTKLEEYIKKINLPVH